MRTFVLVGCTSTGCGFVLRFDGSCFGITLTESSNPFRYACDGCDTVLLFFFYIPGVHWVIAYIRKEQSGRVTRVTHVIVGPLSSRHATHGLAVLGRCGLLQSCT